MCPVCPGESIDQSQHPLAVKMRALVREKLEEGWTDAQIGQFFVERYGPSVLLEPPMRGASLLAWLVPPAGLALAAGLAYSALRAMRRRPGTPQPLAGLDLQLTEGERSHYEQRIEAALSIEQGDRPRPNSEPAS